MASIRPDVATKVSTNGKQEACFDHIREIDIVLVAQLFVESYYPALNSHREKLASFYTPAASMPDGKPIPIITWNGSFVPDPATLQQMFEEQFPQSRYVVQSYDCHVLNPDYNPDARQGRDVASGKYMSIVLTVSGNVKYGAARNTDPRGFSESFVLVPTGEADNQKERHPSSWLVQSQNFRLVV